MASAEGDGGVHRGDRRLQLVRAGAAPSERLLDQRRALGDLRVVPAGAVLVGQEHEVAAVVDTGVPAGVVQEHQREQSVDLGLVGHQRPQHPAQADGLVAQLAADQLRRRRWPSSPR